MSRRPSTAAALVAFLAALTSACTGGSAAPPGPDPVPVKIAFLDDMSVPGATASVTPALLGLQLALQEAIDRGGLPVIPEVVELDVAGDATNAAELAREVADDPSYVAAVIGPFWSEPLSVGDLLDGAGVMTLSMSELDPSLAARGWSAWRRVVAAVPREAAALAAAIRGSSRSLAGTCVVGDGSEFSTALGGLLTGDLGADRIESSSVLADEGALAATLRGIHRAGCGTVAWTGFGPGAALVRSALTEAGAGTIPVVGSSAMKTEVYLSTSEGTADGTIASCVCVDLSSSTRPEARRFIHDFQSQYGSPPGVLAAEGWDVGGMLLEAFRAGAVARGTVAGALMARAGYEGLANAYRFDADGELSLFAARVHMYRAEGVRWVPLGEGEDREQVPVGTPGYLTMTACRKGRPYVYAVAGHLRGFDVDLAAAIARRLGLTLSWRDLPCRSALRAVARGALDAVLAPSANVPQGTPTSGIALSTHVALVSTETQVHGLDGSLLDRLGPGDTVAVVRSAEAVRWAGAAVESTGATVRIVSLRRTAYDDLVAGTVTTVADLEPEAWRAIERRPTLRVVESVDVGAHEVFVAKGPDARLIAAIDAALARLIRVGRYGLLFAKYLPGTPVPRETGT